MLKKRLASNARGYKVLQSLVRLRHAWYLSRFLFSRSVWYYPLRLDAPLYIEVVFNQIAPDYLEGLLLVLPGDHLPQEVIVSVGVNCAPDDVPSFPLIIVICFAIAAVRHFVFLSFFFFIFVVLFSFDFLNAIS